MRASPALGAPSAVSPRPTVAPRDRRNVAAAAFASSQRAKGARATTTRRRVCPRPRPRTATGAPPSPPDAAAAPRASPIARASPSENDVEEPSALLVECDGVALDAAVDAHRVAFNRAFSEIGLDCCSWTPTLYSDLVRTGDGTGEGLVAVYFNTVGWPTMLATSDHAAFAERVHSLKRKQLRLLAEGGEIPLRKGVIDLVDEALGSGARVAVVAGTASSPEDGLGEAALRAFGRERDVVLLNVPSARGGGDDEGRDDEGDPTPARDADSSSLEAGFAAAAAKLKAQGAAALVASVAASRASEGGDDGEGVVIDPALLAASRRAAGADPGSSSPSAGGISPAWLSAVAATALGVRPSRCAVVAASSAVLNSARAAGMVSVAAPPRSGRALGAYPMAHAVCDGFGAGGGVTWRKVCALVDKNVEQLEALRREAEERKERLG